jgi:hypothetical protein
MQASEAVRIIKGMVFKPGWRMEATDLGTDTTVYVRFLIDTVDTSEITPDRFFPREITLVRDFRDIPELLIDVRDLDLERLSAVLVKAATDIDIHENREFLQVQRPDGTWYAPLHPHTAQGNRAWAAYGEI